MGMMKRWMEEIENRGFGEVPKKNVCEECIHEEAVKEFVSENAVSNVCDYCGKKHSSPIATPLEDIVALVVDSIRTEWNSPEDSGTPYESREGGWLIEPHATEEVLYDEGFEAEDEVISDIVGAINQDYWLKNFSDPTPEIEIQYYWECFCHEVRHKSRFVFFKLPQRDPYGYGMQDGTSSCLILESVSNYCIDLGLLKTMKAGEIVFRARVHDKDTFASIKELGPPPIELARFANRMSPAGVVMFYAANDLQTAIVEAASGNKDKGVASIGEFELLKDITILDLTDDFEIPSLFDSEHRDNRIAASFMKSFLAEFRKPIKKDGREHVEYVPTQIMTEYFKYLFENDGQRIFGIKYHSAQNKSGISYVFFADQEHFVEGKLEAHNPSDNPEELSGTAPKFFSFNKSSVRTAPVNMDEGGGISIGNIILLLAIGYGTKKLFFDSKL